MVSCGIMVSCVVLWCHVWCYGVICGVMVPCLLQIEAKLILARLFQTFKVALPSDYKVEVIEKGTRQPKGDIPCTLHPRT